MKRHLVTRRLLETAFHEASHAVVAYSLGIEYGRVSIVPEPERAGFGCCETAFWRATGERVGDGCPRESAIAILLASAVGVQMHTGIEADKGMSRDFAYAAEIAGQLANSQGSASMEPVLQAAWGCCSEVLRSQWSAVNSLVDALLTHKELNTTQVRDALDPHWVQS